MQNRTIQCNGHTWQVKLQDEADESVVNEIFKFKEYKAIEEIISNATTTIVDVGGHRGFFTLYCRSFNPVVPIITLEPEKQNQLTFEEHVRLNSLTNVKLLPCALAGFVGMRELSVAIDSHNHALKGLPVPGEGKVERVKAITVEELIASEHITSIDILKLDIEGGEYEVFQSIHPDTWSKIKTVVMEYHTIPKHHPDELAQIMREAGFGVQKFPSHFDKTMGFFLARNKRVK